MRDAVLAAANDPFLASLEHAADAVARRVDSDQVQHDYAD